MTSVWPALWPPWKRTTTSARSDSQSTILPLPSSPHCEPTTTTLAMRQSSDVDISGKHRQRVSSGSRATRPACPRKRRDDSIAWRARRLSIASLTKASVRVAEAQRKPRLLRIRFRLRRSAAAWPAPIDLSARIAPARLRERRVDLEQRDGIAARLRHGRAGSSRC